MKTGKGRVLVLLCLVAIFLWFLSVSVALAETEGDFVYTVAGGEATITGYTGAGGDIVIPSELGGYPVTRIHQNAMLDKMITEITFPNTLIEIEGGAFRWNQLTSVTFPDSLLNIGYAAFDGNQITSITWGSGLISPGQAAFINNNLQSLTLPNTMTYIDEGAFMNNEISYLKLPNTIVQILDSAFLNNKLTTVIIPMSTVLIGTEAFRSNELIWVTIYGCDTIINERAFANNQAIPEYLTINARVGSHAQAYAVSNDHTFVAMEPPCGEGNNGTAGRSLGDFVWNDLNQNGIQDAGEPGMAGVTVNLWSTNAACEPVEVIASTATDSNGYYSFTGLMMGNYRVQFVLPAGHEFTLQHVGLDQGLDSNPDPATGVTGCITLGSENNMTVDAGIYYQEDPVEGDDDTNGELPQTGGYPYYILGLLGLVGGALIRRRDQK
jgi:hypothetical protein